MFKTVQNLLKKEKGVTLVELLAVIIILGIIALIAVPAIAGVIDESKYNSLKSSAINAIEAAELYKATNDKVPKNIGELDDYFNSKGVTWDSDESITFEEENGEIVIDGTLKETGSNPKSISFTEASVTDISDAEVDDDNNEI